MEDLHLKDEMEFLVQPEHFQSTFLIMGVLYSVGLIVLLWDILSNPSFGFYHLMLLGLSACLIITLTNFLFFSTVLLTPITRETTEKKYRDIHTDTKYTDWTAIPARTIRTGDYVYNMEILVNNKTVAFVILGYGALTSVIFIFVTVMRSIGNSFPLTKSDTDDVVDIREGGKERKKIYENLSKETFLFTNLWDVIRVFHSLLSELH